jgi:hypothetical protein
MIEIIRKGARPGQAVGGSNTGGFAALEPNSDAAIGSLPVQTTNAETHFRGAVQARANLDREVQDAGVHLARELATSASPDARLILFKWTAYTNPPRMHYAAVDDDSRRPIRIGYEQQQLLDEIAGHFTIELAMQNPDFTHQPSIAEGVFSLRALADEA